MDDERLRRVQTQRATRPAATPIGDALRELAKRTPLRRAASHARVAGLLGDLVDEEFRRHAWVGSVQSGVLYVNVDEPGRRWMYRMKWRDPLLRAIHRDLPELNLVDVRFRLSPPGDSVDGASRARAWETDGRLLTDDES
jgi:hypothetical protein